ncbi:hypothetical protein M3J09_002686 [Ascochyta lentis]
MPTTYTLIPRPQNLSATATLIHRLRHPLRVQRTRHPSLPPSHSRHACASEDRRRPRVEDEWIEAPTRSGSPCQLVEFEDKGEYSEQRYGDVNLYWNSVLVEASEEEKEKRRLSEEKRNRQKRTKGRVFEDSEQLQKAARKNGKGKDADASSQPILSSEPHAESRIPPELRSSLLDHSATKQVPKKPVDDVSNQPTCLYRNTNGETNNDRYITLTENTSVAELPNVNPDHDTEPTLTWNSALERILSSPHVDAEVEATIRARARGRPIERSNHTHNPMVDMRMVEMVPNFSYPIASAQWSERRDDDPHSLTNGYEHQGIHSSTHQNTQERYQAETNSTKSSTSTAPFIHSPSASSDSLYRAPTPPPPTERDPRSVLRDILDPNELALYQEIVAHDPRFTVLLDDAEVLNRQVSLIRKLHTVITRSSNGIADSEDCDVPELREGFVGTSDASRGLPTECCSCGGGARELESVVGFRDRVLHGCWEREESLLNTLFDVRRRRDARRGFVTMFSRGLSSYPTTLRSPLADGVPDGNSGVGSVVFETGMAGDSSLKRRELDALVYIAAQNVRILREDLDDMVN